jgi:hypothetical protein
MEFTHDAIVIGGGLAGLTTNNILSNNRFSTLLIEKSASLGGNCNSFIDEAGNLFDYGLHVLDYNRSQFTANFLSSILQDKINIIKIKRGIVIKDTIIPYSAPLSSWPPDLQSLFPSKELYDDISPYVCPIPRKEFERVYGNKFTELAFDDIALSYPTNRWKLKNGVPHDELMHMIYPWFFPYAPKENKRTTESGFYQDKVREEGVQFIAYPSENGFGSIISALIDSSDSDYADFIVAPANFGVEFDKETQQILSISVNNHTLKAKEYFWAAPLPLLLSSLGVHIIKGHPQRAVLGSFSFENEFDHSYMELLVGDSRHKINRISFPAKIRGEKNNLLQVEFLFPENEETSLDNSYWKENWLKSIRDIGLVTPSNLVKSYDFKTYPQGYIVNENEDVLISEYKSLLGSSESNIHIPCFSAGPQNINRLIPEVFSRVINAISQW